jgi:hypothetical protein
MFENISKTRLIIYGMLAGLLPFLLVLIHFFYEKGTVNDMRNNVEEMQQLALVREKKQALNMAVRNHFRDADHFYIDKYLETLTFLEPEVESIQKLISNKNFVGDDVVKKRLELLTGPGNSMAFSEGVVQASPTLHEVVETLVHPVEVNVSDIQKILSRIDGIDIASHKPGPNRPQLIILDFRIDRKNITEKNEVFQLNLKLLKREFL